MTHTPPDIAALRALAEKAKHGPWTHSGQRGVPRHCTVAQVFDENGHALAELEPTIIEGLATDTAAHIAASNPQVTISLCDEIERLRASEAKMREVAARTPPRIDEHSDDIAIDTFATAMKAKMARQRERGYGGWNDPTLCPVSRLAKMLQDHLPKGDLVDVGNFLMMLSHREGGSAALAAAALPPQEPMGKDVIERFAMHLYHDAHGQSFTEGGTVMEIIVRRLREVERLVREGEK